MRYCLILKQDDIDRMNDYFLTNPFVMRAAFLLTDIAIHRNHYKMAPSDFITLDGLDYECHAENNMSFYSKPLMEALRAARSKKKSLIYMHSHNADSMVHLNSGMDEEMLFRIAYAYVPHGIHASLYYSENELKGRIWQPRVKEMPMEILSVRQTVPC